MTRFLGSLTFYSLYLGACNNGSKKCLDGRATWQFTP
jgi:hypothetical protein